ncbi:MAG: hypothetical protein IPF98_08750 [Gemmatimonadetes bacterium]|nr:hypothetical protein [Gemmatimonadota bacterium]MCC6774014.1 hypothetical protein [Gemmatimonadaceae bacterium]
MSRTKIKAAAQLAVAVLLAACTTDPTAFVAAPSAPAASVVELPLTVGGTLLGPLTTLQPLQRKLPLARDVRVEATIGPDGGTIGVPAAGFSVTVPRGAVAVDTRFSVTALRGAQVAYEFEPHGTVFLRPLGAVQELRVTRQPLVRAALKAGYFADRAQLSASSLGALVSELIAGRTDPRGNTFHWNIEHFSGYIVAW